MPDPMPSRMIDDLDRDVIIDLGETQLGGVAVAVKLKIRADQVGKLRHAAAYAVNQAKASTIVNRFDRAVQLIGELVK